jgi:glutathione peroxidase
MTIRQKILKAVYPLFMWITKAIGKNNSTLEGKNTPALVPFHSLKGTLNNGNIFNFSSLKGKKVLLVNTASNCGYTNQYKELQQLYNANKDKLTIIGFPSNDFKEQEKGSDEEIAVFCQHHFGVSFPLMKKSSVIKGPDQNTVFRWLSSKEMNGWNEKAPIWNFSKYLVDENGDLLNYFGPSVSPLGKEISKAINK